MKIYFSYINTFVKLKMKRINAINVILFFELYITKTIYKNSRIRVILFSYLRGITFLNIYQNQ